MFFHTYFLARLFLPILVAMSNSGSVCILERGKGSRLSLQCYELLQNVRLYVSRPLPWGCSWPTGSHCCTHHDFDWEPVFLYIYIYSFSITTWTFLRTLVLGLVISLVAVLSAALPSPGRRLPRVHVLVPLVPPVLPPLDDDEGRGDGRHVHAGGGISMSRDGCLRHG